LGTQTALDGIHARWGDHSNLRAVFLCLLVRDVVLSRLKRCLICA
jgi:hypothetical protein